MVSGLYGTQTNGNSSPPREHTCKFVLVSGGVISGIGKGLTASSIGVLLKSCGWRVTAIKIDPYLNIDAGTMSPAEHGEVFVLNDGGEVDLDLGNYERFLDMELSSDNNLTTGKIYDKVLRREREGLYLGRTVQVIPHITDTIKEWIKDVSNRPDPVTRLRPQICVIELGGTVGDIESMPFVEALRQLRYEEGDDNFCSVFVSLVPSIGESSEQKTKPTQHGVKNLSSQGLSPHVIVCRSSAPLRTDVKQKLAMFCQVPVDGVIGVHDVRNTYNIPLMLQEQGVCNLLISSLKLVWKLPLRLEKWKAMARTAEDASLSPVIIVIVGKYTFNTDAYISIKRALQHAAMALGYALVIKLICSSDLEDLGSNGTSLGTATVNGETTSAAEDESKRELKTPQEAAVAHRRAWEELRSADGILVPGGFGKRGVEGKIKSITYARESDKPCLGICLGMQLMTVEAVRDVFKEPLANSTEFNLGTPLQAVINMPEVSTTTKGGTMRLGARKTLINNADSMAAWMYASDNVTERHRHRFEVNPVVVSRLEEGLDLRFVGTDESGKRMEIVERKKHRFFMGTQYHPEFASHPGKPSPVFLTFVMAAAGLEITKDSIASKLDSVHEQDPWSDLSSA